MRYESPDRHLFHDSHIANSAKEWASQETTSFVRLNIISPSMLQQLPSAMDRLARLH